MPADDVETRSALVAAVRGSLATEILASIPSENELKAYFTAHRDHYADRRAHELHALLMPLATQPVRWRRSKRYEGGNRFGRVTASYGLAFDGKVDDGEEFYFAAAIIWVQSCSRWRGSGERRSIGSGRNAGWSGHP